VRAQKASAIRRDISPGDVLNLIGAVFRAAPADQWRRHVEIVLDGLQPPKPV
jgi:transcriptional regulator SbtR-like protein